MQQLLTQIENDHTLMLMAGIALAVLLIILLVIVVSAMKVKTYKDRYWNTKVDNEEKTEKISALAHELQAYKAKNTSNEQALQQFAETKERLKSTSETLSNLQEKHHALEDELGQIKTDLQNAHQIHAALLEEHHTLQERHNVAVEDNSRYRTNNARLLMKLESEERQTSSRNERINKHQKEIKGQIESVAKKVAAIPSQTSGGSSSEDPEKVMAALSEDLMKISRSIEGMQRSLYAEQTKVNDSKENLLKQAEQLKEQSGDKDD